jgi:hypothetical protein
MLASTITCSRHTPAPSWHLAPGPAGACTRHFLEVLTLLFFPTPTPAQERIGQHPRSTQLLHRQPVTRRRLPTIRPRLRQRHRPTHTTSTDKHQRTIPMLDIQNLQTLTSKRVKRMRHS